MSACRSRAVGGGGPLDYDTWESIFAWTRPSIHVGHCGSIRSFKIDT
jgi:hypothetical protein